MKLFNMISFEINSVCNRRCWFCPNAYNTRPDEYMPLELIEKFATELGEIKYDKRVELYIYNEPMRDNRLLEIIKLIRELVPKSTIMVATNGDYVKESYQLQDLFDSGLNQLQINVYSNMKRYKQLSALVESTDSVEGNVYSNTSPKKKLYSVERKFEGALTPNTPKVGKFELSNRSGNVPKLEVVEEPIQKLCVRPFRVMQVNWKGEVILCCNDYHAEVVCGDATTSSLKTIWENSETLKTYRKKLLKKDRNLPLCDTCSFKGGEYQHFIKDYWPELQ